MPPRAAFVLKKTPAVAQQRWKKAQKLKNFPSLRAVFENFYVFATVLVTFFSRKHTTQHTVCGLHLNNVTFTNL